MNHFPAWKNLLIGIALLIAVVYAAPNLYGDDPSVQISPLRGAVINSSLLGDVKEKLQSNNIIPLKEELSADQILLRFSNTNDQLSASDIIKDVLGNNYVVALNLAPATPQWLRSLNAAPMYLGLDLRGGVHFLLEVDMQAAEKQAVNRSATDIRQYLRENKLRYLSVLVNGGTVRIKFRNQDIHDAALSKLSSQFRTWEFEADSANASAPTVKARMSAKELVNIKKYAVQQNIITLKNRVNELGVAEPVIQRQGENRIVVELPGIQDTARAKEILGATATLEYHMVDTQHSVSAAISGRVPLGAKLYNKREGGKILLKKQIIVTGSEIIDASSGIESDTGSAMVSVSLDGPGGKKMSKTTRENIGKPMAVVFIENRTETKIVDGKPVRYKTVVEEVINVATIRGHFSNRFQTTGLDNSSEARDLALLLRAGALAAPIDIVEERTVGPSLGQDNIDMGFNSVLIGFALVLIFMAVYYKTFGLFADIALATNLIFIIAILSLLQATLTLPGIAGIVLTVGMAVDANVLIFERIKEELRNGNSPQASIHAGYEKAFSTIADANVTTLIAAVILFGFGTGPIKGFAITLSIGILTSMFTAIVGTRALVNATYGSAQIDKLKI
ncbi:MAG: preprotein translocase subunit SecD [Cycloclasticus sp. symbiont of Bathymodiolus heckerae]|nr:MAG: preprotein translocase subunit SecD [Cycloclasticus sp. symbiont of Bathymodiolus heckerae]